jgi:HEAT repeat protein
LTVEELLEALQDPRFNVRFEAILAIARRKPDRRLTKALIKVLKGSQPALSVVAAWALARARDEDAITSLREGLNSHYRSVQDHSARALGTLGDKEIIPILISRLQTETDLGLQMAYASALGPMQTQDAIDLLIDLLYWVENPELRMELALSLSRMIGDEHTFIRLMRRARVDPGVTASQMLSSLKKKLCQDDPNLLPLIDDCANTLAREDLSSGISLLSMIIHSLPVNTYKGASRKILNECANRLGEFGFSRPEYLILTLHSLNCDQFEVPNGK